MSSDETLNGLQIARKETSKWFGGKPLLLVPNQPPHAKRFPDIRYFRSPGTQDSQIIPAESDVFIMGDDEGRVPGVHFKRVQGPHGTRMIEASHGSSQGENIRGTRIMIVSEDSLGHLDKAALHTLLEQEECDAAVVTSENRVVSRATSGQDNRWCLVVSPALTDPNALEVRMAPHAKPGYNISFAVHPGPDTLTQSPRNPPPVQVQSR
jgi:hypothetical protein